MKKILFGLLLATGLANGTIVVNDNISGINLGGGGGGAVNSVNTKTGTVVLGTDDIAEGSTNLYYLSSRARAALSASSPITYNSSTGAIGCQTASGSQAGCLSSGDWTAFNGKGAGTVTSVAASVPSGFAVSGAVTSAGTLAVTYATGQAANKFLATPDGTTGALSLRTIVAGDLPAFATPNDAYVVQTLVNASHTYASGDARAYRQNPVSFDTEVQLPNNSGDAWDGTKICSTKGSGSNGAFIRNFNDTVTYATLVANEWVCVLADNATWNVMLTAAETIAPMTSANLATILSDETGTGVAVFSNSPTLVTPALGTPASGVATNLTGLPLSTGVTGILPTANAGVPTAGTTSQVLTKNSNTNFDYSWATPSGGGGASSLGATLVGFGNGSNVLTGSANLIWNDTVGWFILKNATGTTGVKAGLAAGSDYVIENDNASGGIILYADANGADVEAHFTADGVLFSGGELIAQSGLALKNDTLSTGSNVTIDPINNGTIYNISNSANINANLVTANPGGSYGSFKKPIVFICKTSANANTIAVTPNGAELIDGVNAPVTLRTTGECLNLASDTTNGWHTINHYNPINRADGDFLAQTAAKTIATVTAPNDSAAHRYRIGGYVTVTAVAVDVAQLQVAYTDENNNAQTIAIAPQGTTAVGLVTTGIYTYPNIDLPIKANTTITESVQLTTGGGSITYDCGGSVTQLK